MLEIVQVDGLAAGLEASDDAWSDPVEFDRQMRRLEEDIQRADAQSWKNDRCKWKTTNKAARTSWVGFKTRFSTFYGSVGKQRDSTRAKTFGVSDANVDKARAFRAKYKNTWEPFFMKCVDGAAITGAIKKDYTQIILPTVEIRRIEKALGGSWAALAAKYKLPTGVVALSGERRQVSSATHRRLATLAGAAGAPPPARNTPIEQPAYVPKSARDYPANSLTQPITSLQSIVIALGQKAPGTALTDGLWGPTTQRAWAAEARAGGLDPYMAKVTSSKARINSRTLATLRAAATTAPSPAPKPAQAPPPPPPAPLVMPRPVAPYAPQTIAPMVLPPEPGPMTPIAPLRPVQAGMLSPKMLMIGGAVALGAALLAMRNR